MRGSEPGFHLRILETIALLQTHNLAHPELIIKQWPHSDAFLKIKVLFPSSSKLVEELNTENVMGGQINVKVILVPCPMLSLASQMGRA